MRNEGSAAKQESQYANKVVVAAVDAINSHRTRGIGTRQVEQWDDHDVLDNGILSSALADNGLGTTEHDVRMFEDIVSPIVFRKWYGENTDSRLEHALTLLKKGGAECTADGDWQFGQSSI